MGHAHDIRYASVHDCDQVVASAQATPGSQLPCQFIMQSYHIPRRKPNLSYNIPNCDTWSVFFIIAKDCSCTSVYQI